MARFTGSGLQHAEAYQDRDFVSSIFKLRNFLASAHLLAHVEAQETCDHVKAMSHESFTVQKGKASDSGNNAWSLVCFDLGSMQVSQQSAEAGASKAMGTFMARRGYDFEFVLGVWHGCSFSRRKGCSWETATRKVDRAEGIHVASTVCFA